VSARDSYQRPVKEQRAAAFRKVSMQRDLPRWTAQRTLALCLQSPNREVPGTFAHDVVSAMATEEKWSW